MYNTGFLYIFKRILVSIIYLSKDMKVVICPDIFLSYNYLKFSFNQILFFSILPAGKRKLNHL